MTYRKLSQICYTLNLLMKHDEVTNHHIWPFRKQITQEIFAICKVTKVALNYLMGIQITQSLQILFTTPYVTSLAKCTHVPNMPLGVDLHVSNSNW
jgi:hypothetical protein